MKLITYIESADQMRCLIESPQLHKTELEVIIGCTELSRYSKTTWEEMLSLLAMARAHKIDVVFLWDALNQEEKFQKACDLINRLPLHDFKAIRLQDPGALEFVKNKFPWQKIQLILENGNHNLEGLTKWCEYLGDQGDRLLLSNELSRERLHEYACALSIPLEVLTFGRILLFYGPRKLLSPLENESEKAKLSSPFIEAFGTSEESPHSGFPLIENSHGTFMFNVKDLYLLDHLAELEAMGLTHGLVDLRFDNSFKNAFSSIMDLFSGTLKESELTIKKNHPRPLIKGFYNINKTDVLFTKLKNKRTQRNDLNYIGEIVDVERDCQLALMIKANSFKKNSTHELKMITPEGKEKLIQLAWMKSSLGESVEEASKNDLVLIPYIGGVSVKTQVYLNPNT